MAYTTQNNQFKQYHQLTIIQKINVKGNVRGYAERFTNQHRASVMYVAVNDLRTIQYDTPYYFSGPNPLY
jgi:hypothetical protein